MRSEIECWIAPSRLQNCPDSMAWNLHSLISQERHKFHSLIEFRFQETQIHFSFDSRLPGFPHLESRMLFPKYHFFGLPVRKVVLNEV